MRRRYQELFKQINQYQRGRKFTARATGREIHRERVRERGGERERKKRFHREASGRTSLISLKQFANLLFSNFLRENFRPARTYNAYKPHCCFAFRFLFFTLAASKLNSASNQPQPHPLKNCCLFHFRKIAFVVSIWATHILIFNHQFYFN